MTSPMLAAAPFAQRRARLLELMGPDAVALLPGASVTYRSRDSEYPFRFSNDLAYLTGFTEPDCALVLSTAHEQAFTLFVRPNDPSAERWNGSRAGLEGARDQFGAQQALPFDSLTVSLLAQLTGSGAGPDVVALVLSQVRGRQFPGVPDDGDLAIHRALTLARLVGAEGLPAPERVALLDEACTHARQARASDALAHAQEAQMRRAARLQDRKSVV